MTEQLEILDTELKKLQVETAVKSVKLYDFAKETQDAILKVQVEEIEHQQISRRHLVGSRLVHLGNVFDRTIQLLTHLAIILTYKLNR